MPICSSSSADPIGVYEADAYPFLTREIALLERRLAQATPYARHLPWRTIDGPRARRPRLCRRHQGDRLGPGIPTKQGAASCLAPLAEDGASVLHWHGDTFDLPEAAIRLASNDAYDNQAFAYGRHALALQFHLEADPRQLEEWYVGHAVELAAAGISIAQLRSSTAAVANRLPAQADRIFTRWIHEIS
jgi:GMP synthase (glutamine-hydrolysing)